jgi:hypothetical protein
VKARVFDLQDHHDVYEVCVMRERCKQMTEKQHSYTTAGVK